MKKNITINMLGRLYAIDEDAYGLLQQYIDTLRSYFAHKPDGKEIADDIEARIALTTLRHRELRLLTFNTCRTSLRESEIPKRWMRMSRKTRRR
mgnify:CR=1 FL=1